MKRFRMIGALAGALMMVAVLALPATAANEIGTVGPGLATVGSHFVSGCDDNTGEAVVGGKGLYLPTSVNGMNRTGVFHLITTVEGLSHYGLGTLEVCGFLRPVNGVGAACGMSQGHDGRGKIAWDSGDWSSLTNIGWPATAGGTLPVTGTVQDNPSATDKTKLKSGDLVAQIQAQGGQDCLNDKPGNGAKTFTTVGTFEVIQ